MDIDMDKINCDLLITVPENGDSGQATGETIPTALADLIISALEMEVAVTPKPGLVDQSNRGSHTDMDLALFQISARALFPHFKNFAAIGCSAGTDLLLPLLREPGKEAEITMLDATGGVNTHKGLIFSLGLFAALAGRLSTVKGSFITGEDFPWLRWLILDNTRGLTKELAQGDSTQGPSISNGILVFRKYGFGGIRGEAEAGFPAVFDTGYPALTKYLKVYTLNTALVLTLLELCLVTGDSNIMNRGGLTGLNFLRAEADRILRAANGSRGAHFTAYLAHEGITNQVGKTSHDGKTSQGGTIEEERILTMVRELDQALIQRKLSPGGAADNLAITIFLALLSGLIPGGEP